MNTFNNISELVSAGKVDLFDTIVFGKFVYEVRDDHLSFVDGRNDVIFGDMERAEQYKFCEEAYGYACPYIDRMFPPYKYQDFAAAYRVAMKIYQKLLRQNLFAGQKVWVSSVSEECAKDNRFSCIYVGKLNDIHVVKMLNDDRFVGWNFVVPAEEPPKVNIEITKSQYEEMKKVFDFLQKK